MFVFVLILLSIDFSIFELMFDFILEFMLPVLPLVVDPVLPLVVVIGDVVVIGVDVFIGDDVVVVFLFMLDMLLLFVLPASPGQAALIMPKTKTAERAKVFFICI
jgi:hypothetical protein